MWPQIAFASRQKAHKLVHRYSRHDLDMRAEIRHLSPRDPQLLPRLEESLAQELYLLDVTDLALAKPVELKRLSQQLRLKDTPHDPVQWANLIALIIVRDHVPYRLDRQRRLILTDPDQ